MSDVKIMNAEHVDAEAWSHYGWSAGLVREGTEFAIYLYYPGCEDEHVVLYDQVRDTIVHTDIDQSVVEALNHESIHLVLRREFGRSVSLQFDRVTGSLPEEYDYTGF